MRRASLLLATVAFAVGLAGCIGNEGQLTPKGEAPVTLGGEAKRSSHEAKLANRIPVTFPPARVGYVWQINHADARYVQQITEAKPAKTEGEALTLTLFAIRPGLTRLRFILVPAGAGREAVPVDVHELTLKIEPLSGG